METCQSTKTHTIKQMRKTFLNLALLVTTTLTFAQSNKSVEIEQKIQSTIQNSTFIPEL